MSRLRILHTEASCGWGGQEIRILEESAGLIARGHEASIAAPTDAPIFLEAQNRGIPVFGVPLDKHGSFGSLAALIRTIRTVGPDLIVTHSSDDSWQVSIAARFLRRPPPIVRVRHISTAVRPHRLNRWLYGRVPARVVTTGEALRCRLVSDLGLEPEKVVSIPTGIDAGRFVPGDRAGVRRRLGLGSEFLVGIVATLRSWKGHPFLLAAMIDPRLSDARLVIVGDGPERADILRLTAELNLGDRVVFAGRQDDVVPWLQALDVFALPSTANEGVPQALMQAMACGVPVVTTAVGAIPELVEDGTTGLLTDSESPAALADAIVRLRDDETLRRRVKTAARRRIEERHTTKTMLDAMERVFAEASRR